MVNQHNTSGKLHKTIAHQETPVYLFSTQTNFQIERQLPFWWIEHCGISAMQKIETYSDLNH